MEYAPSASERPLSENPTANAGNGNATVHQDLPEPAPYRRSGGDFFLIGTFVLGVIGWLTSFVAQAYSAANGFGPFVRILWFAFVIQTILLVLVAEVIVGSATYNAAYAYGTQISMLASLATVFAVIGVDGTIYTSVSSLQAVGAGWLIVALVDLSWIIYLTSPPQGRLIQLTSLIGSRRAGTDVEGSVYGKVEKIGRSTDAFALAPLNAGSQQRGSAAQTDTDKRKSQNKWSNYTPTPSQPQDAGARGTMTTSEAASVTKGLPEDGSVTGNPTSEPPTHTEPESIVKWRAQALFDYTGSADDPSELTFKKGDTLLITEKSGKWWEAKTRDGRKGIAPSNYLQLL